MGGEWRRTKSEAGKDFSKKKELKGIGKVFSTVFPGRETEESEVPWGKGLERRRLKWNYFVTVVGIQIHLSVYYTLYCI